MAGFPEIVAVTEIANMIIDAMPDGLFIDENDYVDTCYTIVKGLTYNNLVCAGNNATVSLMPFLLQKN